MFPKKKSCRFCKKEAISACSGCAHDSLCSSAFCSAHGVPHDLTKFKALKLCSPKEEQEVKVAERARARFLKSVSIKKDVAYCKECVALMQQARNSKRTRECKWSALVFFLGMAVGLYFILQGFQDLSEAACFQNSGLESQLVFSYESICEVKFTRYTTFDGEAVRLQYEFGSGQRCILRWSGVRCFCPLFSKFSKQSLSCSNEVCNSTHIIKLRAGNCITNQAYTSYRTRKEFRETNDECPTFLRYWPQSKACVASYCPTLYQTSVRGYCILCPPYHFRKDNTCLPALTPGKYRPWYSFVKPHSGKPSVCTDPKNFERFDSLGSEQCLTGKLPRYTDNRTCQHHEILHKEAIGCSFECPPYTRYDFVLKECRRHKCQPEKEYLLPSGYCQFCHGFKMFANQETEQCEEYPDAT